MKFRFFALFLLSTILITSCAKPSSNSDEKPIVAVSIPPYISLVEAIAGDKVTALSAISENQNPHLTESSFKQMGRIDKARLFIGIGEDYEAKVLSVLKSTSPHLIVLEMNKHFPLLKMESSPLMLDGHEQPSESNHTHMHSHKHDQSHGHHHHHHEPGSFDPHFFLSPRFLKEEARLIKEALIEIMPENKRFFENSFIRLREKIEQLNLKLDAQIGRMRGKGLLVSHSALGYFCHDFDLKQYALEDHGKPLLPKTLDYILKQIPKDSMICAFSFVDHNNKALLQVAEKLGLRTYEINPMARDLMKTISGIGDDLENAL